MNFVRDLTVQVRKKSQYFWAYMIGAIGFELILDAIIAFFTGGTSLAVSFANKISRATAKATQAGIKLAKQVGKKVMTSIDDIYKFLKKEFTEFVEAIKNGELLEWLQRKIAQILDTGAKVLNKFFKDFDAEDLDWMLRKQKTGNLGGKILTTRQIKAFRKLLKERYDVELIFEGAIVTSKSKFKAVGNFKTPKQLFEFMSNSRPPKVGVFDSKTKQMLLPKNSTEIIAFHELAHVKHWKSVGNEAYKNISKLDREMNVWEQIFKNKDRWTKAELEDALDYINRERKKVDLPLLNLEL